MISQKLTFNNLISLTLLLFGVDEKDNIMCHTLLKGIHLPTFEMNNFANAKKIVN